MKKIFIALLLLSTNAFAGIYTNLTWNSTNAVLTSEVGYPSISNGSKDYWQFQCPSGTKSATFNLYVGFIYPSLNYSQVSSRMVNSNGAQSPIIRFKYGVYGVPYQWSGAESVPVNQWTTQTVSVQKDNAPAGFESDPSVFGQDIYHVLIKCMTGTAGTGTAKKPVWAQITQDQ